ncbi:MAG: hypothetical protein K5Q00_05775, partial [Gammaproteobacteria bacterium]|nr:hypothetical protein [Gammaproteobacteria bacterium]
MFPVSGPSPFALAPVGPICPTLPLIHSAQCYPGESARNKKLPLEGGTSSVRAQITKIFQQAYNPVTYKALDGSTHVDDSVAARFETVINYLPGFKIVLTDALVGSAGAEAAGVFNSLTRKFHMRIERGQPIDPKSISLVKRHEMIHAEKATQNNYLRGANPYTSNPYSTSKEKEALRKAIKTGINRANKFITNFEERDPKVVNWLKHICEKYKETYDLAGFE